MGRLRHCDTSFTNTSTFVSWGVLPAGHYGLVTSSTVRPLRLAYPFTGRWRVRNSPARRIPSHGTDAMGMTYAINFVAVGPGDRGAPLSFGAAFGTEPPEKFVGFGAPVTAPIAGRIVESYDGAPDHVARRSQLTLAPYLLSQGQRLREGICEVAGNYVVIDVSGEGPFVLLAHLQQGSVCVRDGDFVEPGQRVGRCGNSGNSTQPHVHVQVTDSTDWPNAVGMPIEFRHPRAPALPAEQEIVDV